MALFSHVIKRDACFFVADAAGQAAGTSGDACGLYFGDTRVLSRYVVGVTPGTLSATTVSFRAGDSGRVVLLADRLDSLTDPPRQVVVERRPVIADGMYERVTVTNYGDAPCRLELWFELGADFRDMFEVRGMKRPARGRLHPPEVEADRIRFRYRGLDGLDYVTEVRFTPAPAAVRAVEPGAEASAEAAGPAVCTGPVTPAAGSGGPGEATSAAAAGWVRVVFPMVLPPTSAQAVDVVIRASIGSGGGTDGAGTGADGGGAAAASGPGAGTDRIDPGAPEALMPSPPPPKSRAVAARLSSYEEAEAASRAARRDWLDGVSRWRTDNALVNEVLDQSLRDVYMLLTDFGHGLMPTAGVPWYAVPFGRDSLISSMQLLPVRPDVLAATLRTLARWQGTREDPLYDEEPGKILHELRSGEMARTKEIPFVPYYGTVDATPLFVMAAGEYWRWTGDRTFLEELMPAVRRAVAWMDAAADEDGYIGYRRALAGGLTNQGWKDSGDAIVHRDGSQARPPIYLAEVQSYVYGARLHYAALLEALGENGAAAGQRRRAEALKEAFHRDFWVEETQFFAMALDGGKAPVAAVGSNPGHGLWTGIIGDDRADAAARALMSDHMFSGYGVRTLSAAEKAYHPLSYHRGTVWPHDNALIALGLARRGRGDAAARIAAGLFAAASFDRDRRLPELFGGCPAGMEGPAWYPVACVPQAWAAAAPFMLLQAALGLEVDAPAGRVTLAPVLPEGIDRVIVDNLAVGARRLRIEARRREDGDADVDVQVAAGEPLEVQVRTGSARGVKG